MGVWRLRPRPPEGKNVPARLDRSEALGVPLCVLHHRVEQCGIDWNRPAFPCRGLAITDSEDRLSKIHPLPLEPANLGVSLASIQR